MRPIRISFYFVTDAIWLCIKIAMVSHTFQKVNGCADDAYKVQVGRSIAFYAQIRAVHLNKPIKINGRMLYVLFGYRRCALQTLFSWSQSIRLKWYQRLVGGLRATFASRKALVRAFSVNETAATLHSMSHVPKVLVGYCHSRSSCDQYFDLFVIVGCFAK